MAPLSKFAERKMTLLRCWAIGMLLAAALVVGCKKQDSSSNEIPTQAASDMPPASPRGLAASVDATTNAVEIADSGDVNVTLQRLTQALRDYVVRTRSVPKTFEEFASKSQVRFPAAPAGKKYAIQDQAVILVKQ